MHAWNGKKRSEVSAEKGGIRKISLSEDIRAIDLGTETQAQIFDEGALLPHSTSSNRLSMSTASSSKDDAFGDEAQMVRRRPTLASSSHPRP